MAADKAAGMDPKRIVVVFYVFASLALGVFLEKLFGLAFSYTRWNDFPIFGEDWTLSTVLGFALAAAVAFVVWRMPRTQRVSLEIASELKKVTWPTLRETRAATVAVLVATAISAIILGAFDSLWSWLSGKIY
jgi:preprotein translocase subunit SecE